MPAPTQIVLALILCSSFRWPPAGAATTGTTVTAGS